MKIPHTKSSSSLPPSSSPGRATVLRATISILTLLLTLFLPTPTRGDQSPPIRRAFDPATGRNLLNYPPHRWADIRHMRLQLRIPSMNDRTILASETLTIAPIAGDLSDFRLDAGLLQISSISAPNRTCTFTRADPDSISIHLDPALPLGQTLDLTINYRVSDPPEGIIWTTESPDHPGRPAQLYSQGESDCNHYWFACHDAPNERSTSELIVTVPRGFQAVSNGRLESTTHESLEPFDTFHWIQDRPHPAYLVSLVVGKFDIVDVGSSRLPMPVYVAPGQATNARITFARTPRMIALLERLTSRPYPWDKYAQVSAINFGWGGMENTSATTLFDGVTMDPTAALDGDEDDLLVHELAHQWFGDLVTCKSWEHIWLNEGFATYAEALWVQYQAAGGAPGPSSPPNLKEGAVFHSPTNALRADQAAYDAMIWAWMSGVMGEDHAAAPSQPAMVSKEYDTPGEVFDRKANPYAKGALILHMLRQRLGDDTFFRGLADYLNTHALTSVETFQFRKAMERASGQSLQRFFDQWCYRPGHPDLSVSSSFENGTLKVAFEQHQPIDGDNPAFDLRIPVWALVKSNSKDDWTRLEARFDTRAFTLEAPLPAAPSMVLIDPELSTLADITIATDTADLAAQLRSGPTPGSRFRAAALLAKATDSPEIAATALAETLHSTQAPRDLRIACARSLGTLAGAKMPVAAASDALRRALDSRFPDARIRAAVIEQSAHAHALSDSGPKADLAARCSRIFAADPSYAVRAAAVRGIGILNVAAELPTVLKALQTSSHREQIRQAAITALTDLDTPEAYAEVIKRTGPANPSMVRSAATAALADLAHHDQARTITLLATLLDDREPRTAEAAGNALADIGGPKVRGIFQQHAEASPSRSIRGQMKVWLQRLPK